MPLRPMAKDPGIYQLHLHLAAEAYIEVGRLGTFLFPAGYYLYTGSALGGLERRLARHQRSEKKRHWHIDYLLDRACIERIAVVRTRERLECALNAEALARPGARVIAARFGSSDCRCRTHLVYLAKDPCGLGLGLRGEQDGLGVIGLARAAGVPAGDAGRETVATRGVAPAERRL